jgi:N4-gp56 family major capsid protein
MNKNFINIQLFADANTVLANVVDPEVMAPMITARVDKKLAALPYVKVDRTLQGAAGSTITVPVWRYIGEAVDLAEGEKVDYSALTSDVKNFTIKQAAKGVKITDKALTCGYGDPLGEATKQLGDSIYGKCDTDCIEAFYDGQLHMGFTTDIGYDETVKAIDAFNEEINTMKLLYIHPEQVADIRLDSNFLAADKYNGNKMLFAGEIGMIANARVIPSKRVKFVAGQWHDILVKTEGDAETENELPAITLYLKRDTNVESGRDIDYKLTKVNADRIYVAALTNASKVVILKCAPGTSIAPLVINYNAATYLYPLEGSTYSVPATGYNFTAKAGTGGVTYEINVAGTIPLIPAATKTGLGFNSAVTNIFMANIEIKTHGQDFDITKLKYCRHGGTLAAVTADDVYTYEGKKFLINCFGVYDTDGAGTIGNYVTDGLTINQIDIQYDGVTSVYKYTYTNAALATA